LIQGVRDPLGGINSLWPLFGIANQMLAAIALCLGTTIILKMQLSAAESKVQSPKSKVGKPALALITLIPLVWLLAVTFTAGVEKIWNSDPRIGFLAQADVQSNNAVEASIAEHTSVEQTYAKASKAHEVADRLYWNNMIDAIVALVFLILVSVIVLISLFEWLQLLSRRKPAVLRETEPVWLPDYALKESGPNLRTAAGAAALAFGLAKELSGETHFERAKQNACACEQHSEQKVFAQVTEAKFNGVRRCC
jgi:carbon starvation protein